MDSTELRAIQAPLKRRYREDPDSALVISRAEAHLGPDVTCTVPTWPGDTVAGLHESTGGDGSKACSADMLLQALAACAAVTLNSVATAMGVALERAVIRAEGTWDARGTLGVSRETPVGLTHIALSFVLETDADERTRSKLIELTERYCVIYQTLKDPPVLELA